MENQQPVSSPEKLDTNAIILIFVALAVLIGGILFVMNNNNNSQSNASPQPTTQADQQPAQTLQPTATPQAIIDNGQLQAADLVVGTGAEATQGATVTVHYTGTFLDGKKFDSSVDRGQPFSFQLGAGQVIKGWDMGIAGMKVGGKRKLVIPSQFAYGDQGQGPIPPKTTLVFDVELLKVE